MSKEHRFFNVFLQQKYGTAKYGVKVCKALWDEAFDLSDSYVEMEECYASLARVAAASFDRSYEIARQAKPGST